MVDFEAGAGFSMTGNQVSVNVGQLPDDTVLDMLAEARAVAWNKGLLNSLTVAEGIGSVAVVGDGEAPQVETTEAGEQASGVAVTAEMLVATVNESGHWYIESTRNLNKDRPRKQRFQIVPQDELPGRAKEWLDKDEEWLQAAEEALHYTSDKPLVLLALPYDPDNPVNRQEAVNTWAHARNGKLWSWAGRMAWLQQFPAEQIEGRASEGAVKPLRFTIVETGYDEERRGTRDEQLQPLRKIQARRPAVRSASILEGGILAHRYSDVVSPDWRDTYVRVIEAEPRGRDVPYADDDGRAGVGGSRVGYDGVSRRAVG